MYAVVETGGKQYKVEVGQTIDVERLPAEIGDTVTLDRVLMLADGAEVTIGQPVVEGAHVLATVVDHGKADKVIVFKYRPKERYRRKIGHRQPYTRLRVDQIEV
ncbi:MAG: 50S ribosomal protein L21 [Chloroflexi bacterium]|nr:50S ribosomal protein L21 [Chloroflexota bacterium]